MKSLTKPDQPKTRLSRLTSNRAVMFLLALLAGLALWQLLYALLDLPKFILPGPAAVWQKFIQTLQSGLLWRHFSYTLMEVLLGLLIGSLLASVLGYWLSKSPRLEHFLSPYLVASQSVPVVAIAPLLVIWFGPGLFSKVLICSLVVFFPVLVNTLVGLREVPQDLHELMRSLQATPTQTLRYLEFPASLPIFLGGLRVGATLSVIGAIVGELVGSDRGLGFLINVGRGQYDTALVFVAVLTLMIMASSLYGLILALESRLLSWQTWRQDA
ncbi:MAG: ABC transporter permease [Anaerolineaceae bacterium]